jgi:hypothetical protein
MIFLREINDILLNLNNYEDNVSPMKEEKILNISKLGPKNLSAIPKEVCEIDT